MDDVVGVILVYFGVGIWGILVVVLFGKLEILGIGFSLSE